MVPSYPHNEFIQGPTESLPYPHRAYPGPFIKRHQVTYHKCAIGGPRGGGVSHRLASLVTTNLSSSDAHPKQRSPFRRSIASAPSTPAAPESFYATHVMSSSVKSMGYRFGYFLILLEGCARGVFHWGDKYVRVLLPEDLCNRSPGFCAPLPVGCPMDAQRLCQNNLGED